MKIKVKGMKLNDLNFLMPNQDKRDARFLVLGLLIYVALVLFGVMHHELWRDELEPWLLASNSGSVVDFFNNMKLSLNPYGWYFVLYLLSRVALDPTMLQVTHVVFAIGVVYLFLRHAPLTVLQKLLLCTGYYIVYEYGVISRGYALTLLFLVVFFISYGSNRFRPLLLAIVVLLLANSTSGFGAILSIALVIFLMAAYIKKELPVINKEDKRRFGWAIFIMILSVIVAIKTIASTPDNIYAYTWYTQFNLPRFVEVIKQIWASFVPIPVLSSVQFWNTNFLITNDAVFLQVFSVLASLLIFFYGVLLFSRSTSVLVYYLIGTFGVLSFFYFNAVIFSINASRYRGFLFLVFITAIWLLNDYHWANQRGGVLFLERLSEKLKISRYKNYFLTILLGLNTFAGLISLLKDFTYEFSPIQRTATYLVRNKLHTYNTAGFVSAAVSPISAYTRKEIFYPDLGQLGTFPVWSRSSMARDFNQAWEGLLGYVEDSNAPVLVVLNFEVNTSAIDRDIKFEHQARFTGSVVSDENYYIYLAKKM